MSKFWYWDSAKKPFIYSLILAVIIFSIMVWIVNKPNKEANIIQHKPNGVYEWMLVKSEMPEEVLKHIQKTTNKYENRDLLLAIIKVESHFNPSAKSSQDARGLMGIIPKWWLDVLIKNKIIKSKRDLYDVEKNIAAGNFILGKYFEKYKDIYEVLDKYSGGHKGYSERVFVAMGEINYARMKGKW